MMAAQWRGRREIRESQEARLKRLVEHAYEHVPYYRTLLDRAGLAPETFRGLDDLSMIPITRKGDLQRQPPGSLLARSVDRSHVTAQRSSGSAGQPLTVFLDAHARAGRAAAFLRSLTGVGYRFGRKLLLIASPDSDTRRRGLPGWRYLSIQEPPERLREEFLRFRPDFLYGCVTPLRLLAEEIAARPGSARGVRGVITTAEILNGTTRRMLEDAFGCQVFDFYGLTEMGLVAWECPRHCGLHVAEDAVIVEAIPAGKDGAHRLVMTNLLSRAMPFIRYDSGDVGVLDATLRPCACGRSLTLLTRLEGRVLDCVRLPGGRLISPYTLTCGLERVAGLCRYQVVQTDLNTFTVKVETAGDGPGAASDDIRRAVRAVVGETADVRVESGGLDPARGSKFRPVECRVAGDGR
jgi:phenylacetate-CoA ligase